MNALIAVLIIVAVTAVAVTAMLLVRRGAPEGSYFADGDRAAGVFGVLATGFAVLLGFVVFLAFESYDTSRSSAETEAIVVAQQFETAQFFPPDVRQELEGALLCYARSVVGPEWQRLREGTQGDALNPWGVAMFRTLRDVDPKTAAEQSAYDRWLDQNSDREQARLERLHPADGVIPLPLWIVLFVTAVVIFVFVLFFADSGERAVVQGVLMGSVAFVIAATMLLLWFLDNPYQEGIGGLKPAAMERTLRILDEEASVVRERVRTPCDSAGRPQTS